MTSQKYMLTPHGPCTEYQAVKITAEFPGGGKIEMKAWVCGLRIETPLFPNRADQQEPVAYLCMAAQDVRAIPPV